MKWVTDLIFSKSRRYEIEYDSSAGFYLFVFEDGKCIRDHLQDSLDLAMECAKEDYGIPKNAWRLSYDDNLEH